MRLVRWVLIVAGAALVPLAILVLVLGAYRVGLAALLTAVSALLWTTWAWGYPSAYPLRHWIALLPLAAGVAILGFPLIAVGGLVVLFLIGVLPNRYVLGRLSSIEIEVVGPGEVMPESEALIAAFESDGFRRVGGFRWVVPLRKKVVITSILVGGEMDRFASVADPVVDVVSRFEGRWLTTTSHGLVSVPPNNLRQVVAGDLAELAATHQAALELLGESGVRPDRFSTAQDAIEAALEQTREEMRFIADATTKKALRIEAQGKGDPALADDDRSRRRVDAWLGSTVPA